ncbi:MAG: DUF5063 domain-containing protein [Pseudomonadota bacterium]
MTQACESVAALSRQYCALIEGCQVADPRWLASLVGLLMRLDAAVLISGHEGARARTETPPDPNLDARFELFAELLALLGENDGYWQPFDQAGDFHTMTGSLADDLTDIYCELKQALALWETRPERALSDLCFSYYRHWGQHLKDAKHHLEALVPSHRMPSRPRQSQSGWRPVAVVG